MLPPTLPTTKMKENKKKDEEKRLDFFVFSQQKFQNPVCVCSIIFSSETFV
jgi:hypothetical protein